MNKVTGFVLDALHYGTALVLIGMGLISELGIRLPGIEVNSKVAITAGIGVFAAGSKGRFSEWLHR